MTNQSITQSIFANTLNDAIAGSKSLLDGSHAEEVNGLILNLELLKSMLSGKPQPTTTVWSLAMDAPNIGTQTRLFYSQGDLDNYIWENCIDDYETTTKDMIAHYKGDHEAAARDDLIREGVTYEYESHEVPITLPNATQFVKDMARFTTPEDEIKEDDCEFDDVDDLICEMGSDRLLGEYETFMHMVREARTILNGGVVDLSPTKPTCPPAMQPSNDQRALWANDTLFAFINEVGDSGVEESNATDLLCNFRHLSDAHEWDIESMWVQSRNTYREEIAEQPKAKGKIS